MGIEYEDSVMGWAYPMYAKNGGLFFTGENRHGDTYPAIDPSKADLSGKNVLITGASKGLGRIMALSYAKAGASVIAVASRSAPADLENEIQEASRDAGKPLPKVLSMRIDIRDRKSVEAAVEEYGSHFTHLDILVNNAGYLNTYYLVGDMDPDDWWDSWETNVKGSWLMTKFFLPLLLKSSTKTVVNITSSTSHSPLPGGTGYPLTKFAGIKLTEMLLYEYRDQGLVSHALHPGGMKSDMSDKLPKAIRDYCTDSLELGAHTTVWLTKERREWLNGRYIDANWDMHDFEAKKDEIEKGDLLKLVLKVPGAF